MITRSILGYIGVLGAFAVGLSPAHAQLTPEHLYNPINRPLTVEVKLPERLEKVPGCEVRIALLEAGTAREVASAAAAVGRVDLSTLFPELWTSGQVAVGTNDTAFARPRVLYAQLIAIVPLPPALPPATDLSSSEPVTVESSPDTTATPPTTDHSETVAPTSTEEKVGPALVLQPMLRPAYAARVDRAGEPMFPPAPTDKPEDLGYTGLRVYVDQDVLFDTSLGPMRARLFPEIAPNTVFTFRGLVTGGFYRDIDIHRIASLHGKTEPDIVQLGDPLGTGTGGPGFFIDLEPPPPPSPASISLLHNFGVLSMARSSDPNSAGSQFFICLNRAGCTFLDGKYTPFGALIEGETPLLRIASSPVNPQNRPLDPPVVRSAALVDAAPYGQGAPLLTDPRAKPIER